MVGNQEAHAQWAIVSSRVWDRMALSKLVEGAGMTVAVSTVPSVAALDRLARSGDGVTVILAVGPEDVESRGVASLVDRCGKRPVVMFARDGCQGMLPDPLPRNVVGVLMDEMEEQIALAVLTIAASGLRVVPKTSTDRNRVLDDGAQLLTQREWQISSEICRGVSNKEIARKLGIAVNTVNVHAASIRRKLRVRNRTQIAMRMLKMARPASGAATGFGPPIGP